MAERDRLERILALVLLQNMKGASQRDKIVQLSLAGFTNYEIESHPCTLEVKWPRSRRVAAAEIEDANHRREERRARPRRKAVSALHEHEHEIITR